MHYIFDYIDHALPILAEEMKKIYGDGDLEKARAALQAVNRAENLAELKRFEWAAEDAGEDISASPLTWHNFHTSKKLHSRSAMVAGEGPGDTSGAEYFVAVRGTAPDFKLDLAFNHEGERDVLVEAKATPDGFVVSLPVKWSADAPSYMGGRKQDADSTIASVSSALDAADGGIEKILDILCACAQADWDKRIAAYSR